MKKRRNRKKEKHNKNQQLSRKLEFIYVKRLKNELSDEELLYEVRKIEDGQSLNNKVFNTKDTFMLKGVTKFYIEILVNEQSLTIEDLPVLSLFHRKGLINEYNVSCLIEIIAYTAQRAMERLILGGGNDCESMLIAIDKYFSVVKNTPIDRGNYWLSLIQKRFLNAASKALIKSQNLISEDHKNILMQKAFVSIVKKGNIQFLIKFVDEFKINLKAPIITYNGQEISALGVLFSLKSFVQQKAYLDFLIKKGVHPDDGLGSSELSLLTIACWRGESKLGPVLRIGCFAATKN